MYSIETQEDVFTFQEDNDSKIKQEAEVNFFHEDTGTFVDAKSQISESDEFVPSVPYRKFLPFLRDPGQKINV